MSSGLAPAERMSDNSEKQLQMIHLSGSKRFQLHQLVDNPTSSKHAFTLSLFILALIFFSSTTFVVQTLFPPNEMQEIWFPIEAICVAAFTLEFVLRMLTHPPPNSVLAGAKVGPETEGSVTIGQPSTAVVDESIRVKSVQYNSFAGLIAGIMDFAKDVLNWIDLVAIVPFYVELLAASSGSVQGTRVFRVVRLARVFRIFKLSRYSSRMQVVGQALVRSKEVLVMLVFVLSIVTVVFSSLIYYAERGEWEDGTAYADDASTFLDFPLWMRREGASCGYFDAGSSVWRYNETYRQGVVCQTAHQGGATSSGCCPEFSFCKLSDNRCYEKSPFESIVHSFYFTIVTVTTVGYGDLVPKSPWGKTVAIMCTLTGIIMLALPISIIGVNFTTLWAEKGLARNLPKMDHEHVDDAEDEARRKLVSIYRSFEDVAGAVRLGQTDMEGLLRDTKRKTLEWMELVEENARKCATVERLITVISEVIDLSDPSLQGVMSDQLKVLKQAATDPNNASTIAAQSTLKWRTLSLARRVVAERVAKDKGVLVGAVNGAQSVRLRKGATADKSEEN